MKTFKEYIKEEAPVNAVAHGGVDMKTNTNKLKKSVFKQPSPINNKK